MIHTALEDFTQTGVSPLHGVYYEYPEYNMAYAYNDTFMFCDGVWRAEMSKKSLGMLTSLFSPFLHTGLFVAPVTAPTDNTTQVVSRAQWLPPGIWVDALTGTRVVGNVVIRRNYTMFETPYYARAGFMQPLNPPITQDTAWGRAATVSPVLYWRIWHGGRAQGSGRVIENGLTTLASYNLSTSGSIMTVGVGDDEDVGHAG